METEKVEKKTFIFFLITLLVSLALVVSFTISVARKHSRMKEVLAKKEAIEQELAQLKEKNLELLRLRDALQYDPVQIEKEARESLGYGRPAEVPYKRYHFPVAEIEKKEKKKAHSSRGLLGLVRDMELFGVFVFIIIGVTGFFYGTYWYERRRLRD
ncbi:MAG: septum formation initiator family protein [Candidatus Brocadiales bacterium]|nr:septum formation initiator family protein [Candidatus Brocadiales bacterium]